MFSVLRLQKNVYWKMFCSLVTGESVLEDVLFIGYRRKFIGRCSVHWLQEKVYRKMYCSLVTGESV